MAPLLNEYQAQKRKASRESFVLVADQAALPAALQDLV